MATIGNLALTLVDWAKRRDPDGGMAEIAELLNISNGLDTILWQEGNLVTGDRITQRTSLPTVGWRQANLGIAPSKSTTAQIDESVGWLEAMSTTDVRILTLGTGNPAAVRLSEDEAFVEAMGQMFATTLWYGNSAVDPDRFTGFTQRYNSTTGVTGQNIILGGSVDTDNMSIWLIGWAKNKIYGIFPMGSRAGLSMEDLGRDVKIDSAGGEYLVYRTHFQWDCGLSVKDWRYAVRIANIDRSLLVKTGATGADLIDLMSQACFKVPNLQLNDASFSFYANRIAMSYLSRQINNKTNHWLTMSEVGGRYMPTFMGIPIRVADSLAVNEALVT